MSKISRLVFFFPAGYSVIPVLFIGIHILSLLNYHGTFVKNQLTIWMYSFCRKLSYSIKIMCVFTYCISIDYCSCRVSLKIKWYINFIISFSTSVKSLLGIWPGCIESTDQFHKICHLNNIKSINIFILILLDFPKQFLHFLVYQILHICY